ncbi:MAG: hypothetical protein AB1393_13685 [Candidatus Edwardsbacteria bacterium]
MKQKDSFLILPTIYCLLRRSPILGLFGVIGLVTVLTGCSLFKTRTAPKPSQSGVVWQAPLKPAVVLTNFKNSYTGTNLGYYLDCFTQDFVFLADPYERNGIDSLKFVNWDREVEETVTQRIFTSGAISLSFSSTEPADEILDTLAVLYRGYEFRLYFYPQEKYAKGKSRFYLRREGDYWSIFKWEDIRADTTDWGEIKGTFR